MNEKRGAIGVLEDSLEKTRSGNESVVARKRGKALLHVAAPKEARRRAPEAHQLHGIGTSEHIGHMLISAELKKTKKPETAKKSKENSELPTASHVKTMSRAELLNLSETIMVGGSSLHQAYETGLIGEQALRRLMAEHVGGGNVAKALRQEILEREIDFERDPAVRGIGPASTQALQGGTEVFNKMVEQVAEVVLASTDQGGYYDDQRKGAGHHAQLQQKHRRLIDFGLAGAIVILSILVIGMYLTRG